MNPGSFCQLHNHTEYSLLDGGSRIADLADRAVELGMPALAITDHGAMYGVIDFYQQCEDRGIKPIIGCEVYLTPGDRRERIGRPQDFTHLVLLATNDTGYRNLIKVVTDAHLNGFYYKMRADLELLAAHSEGLIATTACLQGDVAQRILHHDETSAEQFVGQLQGIYGRDSVYLELQDHGIPEQKRVNEAKLRLSSLTGAPVIATNDVHYTRREDAKLHEVLLCIQTEATMKQENRFRFPSDEFYLKSAEEMLQVFGDHPEALTNTMEIAQRCNLQLELGKLNFPHIEVPEGQTPEQHLQALCEEALPRYYPGERLDEARARMLYELDVIAKTGYTGYFLIVGDFVRVARGRGIMVGPGRGSATGSIVAYLLGITELDPLKYNLIFERMLNPERASPPDIDLDFPDDRREDIIAYVKEKYGEDHVAQVITFSKMGPRAAVRDVGRAMEVPLEKVNQIAALIPSGPKATIQKALDDSTDLNQMISSDGEVAQVIEYAQGLEGLVRHCSIHAAAVVIADRPIAEVVPLCGAGGKGAITTQYEMHDVEACGLVKMDFLGLKTLNIITNCLDFIVANGGPQFGVHDIPLDDPKTYELLCRGDTAAVFQLESEGMQNLLRQMQPGHFAHVIALVALYRPGPMQHADEFCRGRHGAEVVYLDPRLKPILEETYGVILYQEQVMKTASELAGFSMPQAEIIMRAMAKKQVEKMETMKPLFLQGCLANGVAPQTAEEVFKRMETFSNYGFNKSHSAAYGLVAYWTAYLKANYPAEFLAAHLSTVMDNSDEVGKYIMECRRMGLQVRPPSVNYSQTSFAVAEGAVVFGLAAIKGFGKASADAIVAERNEAGPFSGLFDFCRRMPSRVVNKSALKQLIQAGAFDEFGDRNALLHVHESAHAAGQKHQEDRSVGQNSLFDSLGADDDGLQTEELPVVPPMSDDEKLAMEREFLGLYVSDHPLLRAAEKLEQCCSCMIEQLRQFPDKETIITGGMVSETKPYVTSNGNQMMFVTLEGLNTTVEMTLFPRVYDQYKDTFAKGDIILVEAQVERRMRVVGDGEQTADVKLLAKRIRPLQGARALSAKRREEAEQARRRQVEIEAAAERAKYVPPVYIEVAIGALRPDDLRRLRETLSESPGPNPVILEFRENGSTRRVQLGRRYKVTCDAQLAACARAISGVTAVWT